MRRVATRALLAAAFGLILTACGGSGGDDDGSGPPVAEGVYGGTLTGGAAAAFQMVMLDGGEYWVMYGEPSGSAFAVSGFVQGTGRSDDGSFSSNDVRDFGVAPAAAGTLNASYDAGAHTLRGAVRYAAGTVNFSGGPIAGSLYVYDTPAALSTIAGDWLLGALNGEAVNVVVSPFGVIHATSSLGCTMSGTVAPRAGGKNVYDITLTFGAAPCDLAGQTVTGIVLAYPLAGGKTQMLVAGRDASRTYGMAAVGTR